MDWFTASGARIANYAHTIGVIAILEYFSRGTGKLLTDL
jgi:hypothetical protein